MRLLVLCLALLLAAPAALAQTEAQAAGSLGGGVLNVPEYVVLTSGDTLYGDVRFPRDMQSSRRLFVDDQEILLNSVHAFQISEGTYGVIWFPGARRPHYLTLRNAGRIDLYAYSQGGDDLAYVESPEGEFVIANSSNLRRLLRDDPRAMSYLNQDRALGVVQIVSAIAAAGLVGYGAAIALADVEGPNAFLVGGAGLAAGLTINLAVPPLRDRPEDVPTLECARGAGHRVDAEAQHAVAVEDRLDVGDDGSGVGL